MSKVKTKEYLPIPNNVSLYGNYLPTPIILHAPMYHKCPHPWFHTARTILLSSHTCHIIHCRNTSAHIFIILTNASTTSPLFPHLPTSSFFYNPNSFLILLQVLATITHIRYPWHYPPLWFEVLWDIHTIILAALGYVDEIYLPPVSYLWTLSVPLSISHSPLIE